MKQIQELKDYCYDVIGAIHEVHKELGAGLNEYVYQEGLKIELSERDIPFEKEVTFHPNYHGIIMEATYRLDFLVKGNIVVELKSVTELCDENRAQLFNYMRLCNAAAGILVNFYPNFAEIERYFYDVESNEIFGSDGFPIKFFRKKV